MGHVIKYKDVMLHRQERVVLKDVSLTVDPGEFVYLIGRVGSGKSTFLGSLYAEVPVREGKTADVLDRDLLTLKKNEIPF